MREVERRMDRVAVRSGCIHGTLRSYLPRVCVSILRRTTVLGEAAVQHGCGQVLHRQPRKIIPMRPLQLFLVDQEQVCLTIKTLHSGKNARLGLWPAKERRDGHPDPDLPVRRHLSLKVDSEARTHNIGVSSGTAERRESVAESGQWHAATCEGVAKLG